MTTRTWSTFEYGKKTSDDNFDASPEYKLRVKNQLREQLAKDIEEFLKTRQITVLPMGRRSQPLNGYDSQNYD